MIGINFENVNAVECIEAKYREDLTYDKRNNQIRNTFKDLLYRKDYYVDNDLKVFEVPSALVMFKGGATRKFQFRTPEELNEFEEEIKKEKTLRIFNIGNSI